MPSSLTSLHYHLVFSTKNRSPMIAPERQADLWMYCGGIVRKLGGAPLQIGGVEDHIHLLVGIPPTIAVSDFLRELKKGSSTWMKEKVRSFAWQTGYGAFTVSRSQIDTVSSYVQRQPEHHRKHDFMTEFRALLEAHGLEIDEKFLW